jgi:hypothetical protein
MPLVAELKRRARRLKTETFALYLVARHPGTPWYAKLFVAGIVAYAFSPFDLIPDFVPVLGYLDDLILIPHGYYLGYQDGTAISFGRVSGTSTGSHVAGQTGEPDCRSCDCGYLDSVGSAICCVGLREDDELRLNE